MKSFAAALAVGTLAALAFAGTPPVAHAADNSDTAAAKPSPVDGLFAREAAEMNKAEIELSEHAVKNATTPAVKAFAQKMIDDHTAAGDKLKTIADSMDVSLPDSMDKAHSTFKDSLDSLEGADYEQAYVQAMVTDHAVAIALFEDEATNGNNAQLKQFAQETLPILKSHQAEAIKLSTAAGGPESGAANK
jgi:putative membrane protein